MPAPLPPLGFEDRSPSLPGPLLPPLGSEERSPNFPGPPLPALGSEERSPSLPGAALASAYSFFFYFFSLIFCCFSAFFFLSSSRSSLRSIWSYSRAAAFSLALRPTEALAILASSSTFIFLSFSFICLALRSAGVIGLFFLGRGSLGSTTLASLSSPAGSGGWLARFSASAAAAFSRSSLSSFSFALSSYAFSSSFSYFSFSFSFCRAWS